MKKKVLTSVIALVFAIALTVTVTYAWFVNMQSYSQIIIKPSSISATVKLYQGNDFNNDGVLDQSTPYTLIGNVGSISASWGPTDATPGKVYTYKVQLSSVSNAGESSAMLTVSLSNITTTFLEVRTSAADSVPSGTWSEASATTTLATRVSANILVFQLRLKPTADSGMQALNGSSISPKLNVTVSV